MPGIGSVLILCCISCLIRLLLPWQRIILLRRSCLEDYCFLAGPAASEFFSYFFFFSQGALIGSRRVIYLAEPVFMTFEPTLE